MSDFPMMLYRDGSEAEWDGLGCDTLVVRDADEAERAFSEGWLAPADYLASAPVVPPSGDEPAAGSNELEELRAYRSEAEELMKLLEDEKKQLEGQLADAIVERDDLKAKLAAFDGDGDGKPGGRRKKDSAQ